MGLPLMTGQTYKCAVWNFHHCIYGDKVKLLEMDWVNDLLRCERQSDGLSFFVSFMEFNNKFEIIHEELSQYESPKCTCGTFKTYGDNVDISAHSDYCDLVRKK